MRDDVLLLPKLEQLLYSRAQLAIALALSEELQGIFTSKTIKRRTCWFTTRSQIQLSVRTNLVVHIEDMCARFLNAVNTGCETRKSAILHNPQNKANLLSWR